MKIFIVEYGYRRCSNPDLYAFSDQGKAEDKLNWILKQEQVKDSYCCIRVLEVDSQLPYPSFF